MAFDSNDSTAAVFDTWSMQETLRNNAANTALSNGIMLFQKKKYKEALSAFKQASALKPDSRDAYNSMANAYLKLGKKEEAVEAYKLSLKVDRNQEQVYINMANINIDLKKPAEAEKALKGALTVNSVSVLAHYTLGHLYVQNNRPKEAEAQFRQVVQLVPKDGNGYYGLGLALNKQERFDEAIKALTKATSLKKNFDPAIAELGFAYAGVGNIDKAQEQVAALKKIDSTTAKLSATELAEKIRRPKLSGYVEQNSSLNLALSAGSALLLIDPAFITPGARKDLTVQFQFDTDMDAASVTNASNWRISKPRGGEAGLYDNGLYRATDASTPIMPSRVIYDSTTRKATLTFSVAQNASGTATLDPHHLVFKFSGKDSQGRVMDPLADEFSGYKSTPF